MSEQAPSLGKRIYTILDLNGSDTSFLFALSKAIESPSNGSALDTLANALERPHKAEQLADLIYPVTRVLAFYKHQRTDPGWRYGTYRSRRAVIESLWARAKQKASTEDESAKGDARAAFLIAAQEAFHFANASVAHLLIAPGFDHVTGWPAAAISEVRRLVGDERDATTQFVSRLVSAAVPLEFLIANIDGGLDRSAFEEVLSYLAEIAEFASGRPTFQWRIANWVWRLANLARFKDDVAALALVTEQTRNWSASIADAHFDRWLNEALTTQSPPPKTVGFTIMSPEELAKRAAKGASSATSGL